MSEAWVKELHPPQRHRTLPKLKVIWSGQGRHRFKVSSRLDMVGTIPPPLSVKIRSSIWSYQVFGVSEERFSSLSAVCFFASMILWRLINFRFPASFLQRCQPKVGLSAPLLLRRKPQVGLFYCLSWRHVKVLRNGSLRQNFEATARTFPASTLRLSLNSLVFSLFILCS